VWTLAWRYVLAKMTSAHGHRITKPDLSQAEKKQSLDRELKMVADAFLELFELLEQRAPVWYTEEHSPPCGGAPNLAKY
jgi:hypothetical protein